VTIISLFYFLGSAGYTALLLAWLFARPAVIAFIEEATPSADLGPTLLLDLSGLVTTYFVAMAVFCCWVGVALWKLQRWAWFVTCAFVVLSFVLDVGLFAHMFRHLPPGLVTLGTLRLAFLVCIVAYLNRTRVRSAFGLSKSRVAKA
jgi:uncharacterized membrane protein (DUF2068 family)